MSPAANKQSPDALAICLAGLRRRANQRADAHTGSDATPASDTPKPSPMHRSWWPDRSDPAIRTRRIRTSADPGGRCGFGPGWLGHAITTPPGVRSPPRQGRPLPNGPAHPGGTHVVVNGHGPGADSSRLRHPDSIG